ncbi:ribonuclease HII [Patescibacteria group bacterium]|nr:ribonuclease HII [Patescibacteria group bacterium]
MNITIGMDEAGRGPWAGPLTAAACFIPKNTRLPGLNDSKKLSPKKREELFHLIKSKTFCGIGTATTKEVEKGLKYALNLAYQRALKQIDLEPDNLIIDGRDKLDLPFPYKSIIKGDQKERPIMAASILAKVTRDKMMERMHKKYPNYRFDLHKGYGTRLHRSMLQKHGICSIHRKQFYIASFGKKLGNL